MSSKKLWDEGLHIFLGMMRYCMKDNGKQHYEFVHHNVLVDDMHDGGMEFAKFGKVSLNNCASFSYSNILQRAHQWAHFCMKNIWVLALLALCSIIPHVQE